MCSAFSHTAQTFQYVNYMYPHLNKVLLRLDQTGEEVCGDAVCCVAAQRDDQSAGV